MTRGMRLQLAVGALLAFVPLTAFAAEADIQGFDFGCRFSNGTVLQPQFGDIECGSDVLINASRLKIPEATSETPMEPFGPEWTIVANQSCQVWNEAVPKHYEGVTWTGDCIDGRVSGHGRLTHGDGTVYEGNMHDGKFHGYGIYSARYGYRYEGEWRDGELHGYGVESVPRSYRYAGEWQESERHGQGTHYFSEDGSYTCEWVNDVPVEGSCK